MNIYLIALLTLFHVGTIMGQDVLPRTTGNLSENDGTDRSLRRGKHGGNGGQQNRNGNAPHNGAGQQNGRGGGNGSPQNGAGQQNGHGGVNGSGNNLLGGHQDLIRKLRDNRHLINRDMDLLEDGVQAWTWSDVPEVDGWIQQHVAQMRELIENGEAVRQRDPLFVAVFENAHFIDFDDLSHEKEKGVYITEFATDPTDRCAIDLIHSHADTVDKFIKLGRAEMRLNHPIPESCSPAAPP